MWVVTRDWFGAVLDPVLDGLGMAGSKSVDPSHYCVDAHSCVLLEAGLLKGNTATTRIQPQGLPRKELNSESLWKCQS